MPNPQHNNRVLHFFIVAPLLVFFTHITVGYYFLGYRGYTLAIYTSPFIVAFFVCGLMIRGILRERKRRENDVT